VGNQCEAAVRKPTNFKVRVIHTAHPHVTNIILENVDTDDPQAEKIEWNGFAADAAVHTYWMHTRITLGQETFCPLDPLRHVALVERLHVLSPGRHLVTPQFNRAASIKPRADTHDDDDEDREKQQGNAREHET
jgi:hypothetical protein